MLAYLANTLIFIMVGVVIMEKALSEIDLRDGFLIIVDYFGICVIRYAVHFLTFLSDKQRLAVRLGDEGGDTKYFFFAELRC
jgi:NhaP-type Na+/H+ or K+/H+ antiporter